MKNKKLKMVISILTILLCLFMFFSTETQASEENNINGWIEQGNKFIANGQSKNPINTNEVKNAVIPIGQALVAIATVILAVVTIIMGIKYMMSGSPDEKAKLKTQLIGLVVSTVVIFGAQVIWSVLYKFMIEVTK